MRYFRIIPILLCSVFLLSGQSHDDLSISILQDTRDGHSARLRTYLHSENARERELALLAYANIQDSSAFDYVVPLLNDGTGSVRSKAAFALGMLGNSNAPAKLFQRLSMETEDDCISQILNGIGLCGTIEDLMRLVSIKTLYPHISNKDIANSIARFANRRIIHRNATRFAASLLNDSVSHFTATYALMRINDTIVTNENKRILLHQLDHPSPVVRMWIATILKSIDDDNVVQKLITIAESDGDWRVRVNAIGALRATGRTRNIILKLIADSNEHVALSAISAYDFMSVHDVLFRDSASFSSLLHSKRIPPSVQEEVKKILAKKLGERALPLLGNWRSVPPHLSAQRIRAYGYTRTKTAIDTLHQVLIRSNHSLVTMAAIESYQNIVKQFSDDEKIKYLERIVPLFAKKDAGISNTIATVFLDSSFNKNIRRNHLPVLLNVYQSMRSPVDLEPMVELLAVFGDLADPIALPVIEIAFHEKENAVRHAAHKAYRSITGMEYPKTIRIDGLGYRPFYGMQDLHLLSKYSGAHVSTSKGTITMTFEKGAAPFTVLNFILLVQKKYFNGLYFHRVVSNFVIQGGDPLGNGSGGPNYSIRTEVDPHTLYKTGSVGMASAGKDTEGSQWFITHCPTPHLDYRYTIFGYTEDHSIVDRIMVGDTIEKIDLF